MIAAVAIAVIFGGWYLFRAKPAAAPIPGQGGITASSTTNEDDAGSPAASIRGYYGALNDKQGATANAYLSKEFRSRLDAAHSQEAADALNSITVLRTTEKSRSDTKFVYETVLQVSPKAGGLTSFSAGENTRIIELVLESGDWKIAKITQP
jgi:hypothetical protein